MLANLCRLTHLLALFSAIAGGLVLFALIALTLASVLGRELGSAADIVSFLGPVPGDYELVELGMGFAIFAFLPWAHWTGSHAAVDLLRPLFGKWGNHGLDLFSQTLMLIVSFVLARQLWLGLEDKHSYLETSFILQIPLWWGYAAAFGGAALFVFVASSKLVLSLFAPSLVSDSLSPSPHSGGAQARSGEQIGGGL
ncbi:MAG: TRAP transporter small permease [Cohaesibacter sp.]|jgi:TRAP-type C4-dicarboxylate transport system permease small subunit|nr:TRAP transporter small permease [Cohaesibacter sp.]